MEQLKPGDPSRVGNYRLIGKLGEGGMGQVFLGLSPGGRQVAVKIMHPGYASGKQFRERFAREIEAARRVGGFHTASVVDADPAADPPWMVTAFIHGPSLQQAVAEGGPFSLERVCRLGAGLAEGLAAIHACGLVHRDLKPSNVILADDGPRIIDFGISRAAEASPMTTAGMVVGTYSYMSPEQLRGEVAGPASDVFALGCMLAFAATARVTFGEDSIVTVVYRITTEPPDLSGLTDAHGFRRLLSECLAKDPADRPSLGTILERLTAVGSAAEAYAGELNAPTTPAPARPEPVPSEPRPYPGPTQPPHPYPGLGSGGAGNGGASGGVGLDRGRAGQPSSPDPMFAPTQTTRADDQTGPGPAADQQHTGPDLLKQDQRPAWEMGPPAQPGAPIWPSAQPGAPVRGPGRSTRRTVLIIAVAALAVVGAVVGILLSSASPKGSHPAAIQSSAQASGHPSARPTVSSSLVVPTAPALSLHDPGGKNVFGDVFGSETVLVTGDSNGSSYLWNVGSGGSLIATLKDPNSNGVNSIAFNPAINSYAMADANGNIYLWNAGSHKLTATLSNGNRDNDRVAISPDGGMVAVGSNGGRTYLWNVTAGKPSSAAASSLHDPGGNNVYGVAFSPDGTLLAAGDTNGSTYLWNVATGQLTATLKDPGSKGLYYVTFSPDGKLLAVSDASASTGDGVVYLWNVSTHSLVSTLASSYNSEFADIAFSPDGRFLAAGDTIGNVSFWNVSSGKYLATMSDPVGKAIIGVAFSPSGDALASTDTAGDAYVWNTKWLGS
jgi:serine/threonine protein kinase